SRQPPLRARAGCRGERLRRALLRTVDARRELPAERDQLRGNALDERAELNEVADDAGRPAERHVRAPARGIAAVLRASVGVVAADGRPGIANARETRSGPVAAIRGDAAGPVGARRVRTARRLVARVRRARVAVVALECAPDAGPVGAAAVVGHR